jgi:hypothetical protein
LEPYIEDGEKLLTLYGWAVIVPGNDRFTHPLTRELLLTSDERQYVFSVKSVYRNPELPEEFANAATDLENLGFSALIAEDIIKPGKYRIGIIFRDTAGSLVLYSDKPAHYLVKTPNTLRLDRK